MYMYNGHTLVIMAFDLYSWTRTWAARVTSTVLYKQ